MPLHCRLDRAVGCLLGLSVGDALGAPLEGLSQQQIRSHYGQVDQYENGARAWKRKPYRWRLPGLYTDDTQQALILADVLIERGNIDHARVLEYFVALATPRNGHLGAHRGPGRSLREFMNQLDSGLAPEQCVTTSAGIGAAMRVAPVAIYFADDPEATLVAAIESSLITHSDVRSVAGAVAVAQAVRRLLAGAEREPSFALWLAADMVRAEKHIETMYGHRVTAISEYLQSLSTSIAQVESLVDKPREQALAAIVEQANRHGADPTCRRPTMGFPPALIPTCLYLLLTADSFREALIDVVNLGGDTDTAGAILGAMAGASFGVDEIPDHWVLPLRNADGIVLRAEALFQRSARGLNIPNLVETERALSSEENTRRNELVEQSLI